MQAQKISSGTDSFMPDYMVSTYAELQALLNVIKTTDNHNFGWIHIKGTITPTDTIFVPNCQYNKSFKISGGGIVPLTNKPTIEFVSRTWGVNPAYGYNTTIENISFVDAPASLGAYPLIKWPMCSSSRLVGNRFAGQSASAGNSFLETFYMQNSILENNVYDPGIISTTQFVKFSVISVPGLSFITNVGTTVRNNNIGSRIMIQPAGRAAYVNIGNNIMNNLRETNIPLVDIVINSNAGLRYCTLSFVNNLMFYELGGVVPPQYICMLTGFYGWLATGNTVTSYNASSNPLRIVNGAPSGDIKIDTNNIFTSH